MASPTDCLKKYLEAHNAHQINKVLTCFADSFRFEMSGTWVRTGTENMRQLEEWDAAVNDHLEFSNFTEEQGTVSFTAVETCSWYAQVNIPEIRYASCVAKVKGNLITDLVVKYAPESEKALSSAFQQVLKWAEKARPKDIATLMPVGEFLYNTKSAEVWMSLVNGWKAR